RPCHFRCDCALSRTVSGSQPTFAVSARPRPRPPLDMRLPGAHSLKKGEKRFPVTRDSLYGERIVWQGRCRAVTVPFVHKVVCGMAAVMSAVTLCYALVVAKSLAAPVGGMVLFAAWCATLALGAWRFPLWWRSKVEFIVTDKHVIWRRGRLRRTIDTRQISYALVRWNPRDPTMGDLVIIRAVPTGALRRTLSLTLHD